VKRCAGFRVKSQRERGLFYQNLTLCLVAHPGCVGWHWFKYGGDGPGYSKGIFDTTFEPHREILDVMKELNERVYPLAVHHAPGLLPTVAKHANSLIEAGAFSRAAATIARYAKRLDKNEAAACELLRDKVLRHASATAEDIESRFAAGDVAMAKSELVKARSAFRGIDPFDEFSGRMRERFKDAEVKAKIRTGADYYALAAQFGRVPAKLLDEVRERFATRLESFAGRNDGSPYARAALEAARLIRQRDKGDPFSRYFEDVRNSQPPSEAPR